MAEPDILHMFHTGYAEIREPDIRYGRKNADFGQGFYLSDSVGYFPDAPTERGVKHLRELTKAAGQGWHCAVAFAIQTEGITEVRPNIETHPAFGEALVEAAVAGDRVLHLLCRVTPDSLAILETGVT